MNTIAIVLLSAATGFAAVVWGILGVSKVRTRHPWQAAALGLLLLANLVSTGTLLLRLSGHPIQLPPSASTAILITLIFIPALLSLLPWLQTKRLLK